MKTARFLTFDIETMANLVWSWDVYSRGGWQAIDTEVEWFPISFGAKWYGEKTKYYSLEQYKGYKPPVKRNKDGSITFKRPNIKPLLQDMWNLFNEADVVCGWNSKGFDVKKMNDQMIAEGMRPYAPFKQVDVMKEKRKLANSSKNSLAYTSVQWKTGEKLSNDGWPLWIKCAEGDKKALAEMKRYCIRDVDQTERNYDHIKGWITNHPNLAALDEVELACNKCKSQKLTKAKKRFLAGQGYKQQYQCKQCGGYVTGTKVFKNKEKLE